MVERYQGDHETCIADLAGELFSQGYSVYLEQEFTLEPLVKGHRERGKWIRCKHEKKIVVDLYAQKAKDAIAIEVGYICERDWIEGRLRFLKTLLPDTKVVHVTQWKNWIPQNDWEWARLEGKWFDMQCKYGADLIV